MSSPDAVVAPRTDLGSLASSSAAGGLWTSSLRPTRNSTVSMRDRAFVRAIAATALRRLGQIGAPITR